ncbi:MAG TPA: hypothetical protein VMJ10_02725 [Kofleriaceae bacterium]|nr:hypothetical protein [Kofleriaceae bacterium]
MRMAPLVLLVGCAYVSTRELAHPDDARLRAPGHRDGFLVATTERWHERVDPNTNIRLGNASGEWTDRMRAGDLFVDDAGVWADGTAPLGQVAAEIHIAAASDDVTRLLAETRPAGGALDREAGVVTLTAPRGELDGWLASFIDRADIPADPTAPPPELGTWRVTTASRGELPPLGGVELVDAIRQGVPTRRGWRWDQVRSIEVTNLSGVKTLGNTAAFVAALPILLPLSELTKDLSWGSGPPPEKRPPWTPELPDQPVADAQRMFSTGARVRAIMRPTLVLDAAGSLRGDELSTGAIARLRFADFYELGGGARLVETRSDAGWARSTTAVFQLGAHVPLDAGFRFAIPLLAEASTGGAVRDDIRFPWGLRYTARSQRWFATVLPATPQYLRLHDTPAGRWSFTTGTELGVTF